MQLHVSLLLMTIWRFERLIAPVVTTTSIILAPIKSRMETFWYRQTHIHLENGP